MNRTKLLTIAVIGLLLLNLGMLSMQFLHGPGHPPMHPEMGPPREGPKRIIIERLHFDADQQKQYEVLIEDHKSKTEAFHRATKEMHDQLYSLLKEEPVNKAAADSLIQKIADDQKGMDNLNFGHFQKIKALCKPDQVKDFNQLAEELAGLFAPKGPPR